MALVLIWSIQTKLQATGQVAGMMEKIPNDLNYS
jgi:hypothetical protein